MRCDYDYRSGAPGVGDVSVDAEGDVIHLVGDVQIPRLLRCRGIPMVRSPVGKQPRIDQEHLAAKRTMST